MTPYNIHYKRIMGALRAEPGDTWSAISALSFQAMQASIISAMVSHPRSRAIWLADCPQILLAHGSLCGNRSWTQASHPDTTAHIRAERPSLSFAKTSLFGSSKRTQDSLFWKAAHINAEKPLLSLAKESPLA